jgi:hypothetical protein
MDGRPLVNMPTPSQSPNLSHNNQYQYHHQQHQTQHQGQSIDPSTLIRETEGSTLAAAIFNHVISRAPKLLPTDLPNNTLTSAHIDEITYAMWQVAFSSNNGSGDMLQVAAKYGSMFSEMKLRALARLNFLPSWWYLRERAFEIILMQHNWMIDDSIVDLQWKDAVRASSEMQQKRERAIKGHNMQ